MLCRPRYSRATGTVPFTIHTASSAITSKSARASPPPKAAKTRSTPSTASAFKRRHGQAVPGELGVVELGGLAMTGPDDRPAGVVDAVRERHPARVVDAGDRLCERERDTLERVVVVVQDDHAPGIADTGAAALPWARQIGRASCREKC